MNNWKVLVSVSKNGGRMFVKCMNKQARRNKAEFEHEKAVEREQAHFDSLTPEEQQKELAEKSKREKKALENACFLGSMLSLFNGSYD